MDPGSAGLTPKARGRGRGIKTSQQRQEFEQSRQNSIASWVQEARENVDVSPIATSGSSSELEISSSYSESPKGQQQEQPRLTSSPIPQTMTQSPASLIASSGILGTMPSLPKGFRGRGRARGTMSPDISVLGSQTESVGPRRQIEDVLPSVQETEDSFVAQFRNMNPSRSAGRGVFRGSVPRVSVEEERIVVPRVQSPVYSTPSLSSSPSGPLQSTTTLDTSSTDSSSDIGTEDYSHLEKAAMVMRGTKGSVLPVSANYIRLKVEPDKGYFEYHVDFEPVIDSVRFKKKIIFNHQNVLGSTRNFDGSKLYLPIKLEQKLTMLHSPHPINPEQQVKINIKYVKRNTFGSSVHFYNILFRRIMNILGFVEMGRNHYDYTKTFELPQHRLEIWPGFVTAIDEYEGGLMLCCDASFRVLRTKTMLDVLEEIQSTCNDNYREVFTNTVLNKIVITRHNNKSYRIDDIAWDQTPMNSFNRGGDMVTFVDYYKNHHKITINDRTQPLLVSRPKPRRDDSYRREEQPLICLIPELSFVTGLSEEMTSSMATMRDITSFTRISPQTRLMALETFVRNIKENAEANNLLNQWGLEIEDAAIDLTARVLRAPDIELNDKYCLKPASADFNKEVTSNRIMMPIRVTRWIVFCSPHDFEKANRFVRTYRQVTGPLGISVATDAEIKVIPGKATKENFRRAIAAHLHPGLQFLVLILPQAKGDIYTSTKIQTLVDTPIPTQMILSKTLASEQKMRAIVTKIALQINCKLGGWLWSLKVPLKEKIMFVGMDVYHDPTNKNQSCLALIASMNAQHTKFFSRIIYQKSRQETGDSIQAIFCQSLAAFYDENHGYPERVVVFRDGVGDGQLALTKEHEVVQFTSALQCVMGCIPHFTFTVVQKRINTRMFSTDNGTFENPPPGTVLDHTVTRKYLFDYFLVSQYVREGTVTPSHYVVIEDNSKMSPDLAQKFAFATTFMYFNFPGTIRVPAVCQYAHKLAFLVGQHLKQSLPAESLAKQLYFL